MVNVASHEEGSRSQNTAKFMFSFSTLSVVWLSCCSCKMQQHVSELSCRNWKSSPRVRCKVRHVLNFHVRGRKKEPLNGANTSSGADPPSSSASVRSWLVWKGCLSWGDLLNDLQPVIIWQCWQGRWFHSLTPAAWYRIALEENFNFDPPVLAAAVPTRATS